MEPTPVMTFVVNEYGKFGVLKKKIRVGAKSGQTIRYRTYRSFKSLLRALRRSVTSSSRVAHTIHTTPVARTRHRAGTPANTPSPALPSKTYLGRGSKARIIRVPQQIGMSRFETTSRAVVGSRKSECRPVRTMIRCRKGCAYLDRRRRPRSIYAMRGPSRAQQLQQHTHPMSSSTSSPSSQTKHTNVSSEPSTLVHRFLTNRRLELRENIVGCHRDLG